MAVKTQIGVIGGSGVCKTEKVSLLGEHSVKTPFGDPSDTIAEMELEETSFFFLPRHGKHHHLLPHEINYRANIFALKSLGVEYLISVSAVGSLQEEAPPETIVLPDQFIDWTKGKRERSFFGKGIVAHVSTAYPVEEKLRNLIASSCKNLNIAFVDKGTYIGIEGPQFSSRSESLFYRRTLGATVIGMTNIPEIYLAKEAGLAYATMAMVTDFDCWKEHHCRADEVMEIMSRNNQTAHTLLADCLPSLAKDPFSFVKENAVGLMTPREHLNNDQRSIVDTLLR